jgi:pentatricopeptide repeat protein
LWSEFREYDSSSIVWDALANSYARSQMIHDALYILSKMNSLNMQISVSTYDSLLHGLRMTDMALELFEEMEACGISHSEYSHSIIIDGLCKQDKVGEALSFLKEAREAGKFKPLGMSFNILMSALCNWGYVQPAKSFLCLMLKYGLSPDRYTYSTLIHGLCKVGSIDEAVDLFERVTEEGMKLETVTYNSLINGYRLLGLTREIPKIIQFMRYQGIEPDLVTYTILIAGHCESGDVEEGMKISKDILDQGLQLNIVTYSVLLNALFRKGLVYEAENLLSEIHSIGLDMDVIAYSILIHGYCKLGEIEKALQVCDVMCYSQKVMPTSLNHSSILLGLCKKGLLVEARWYLEHVASRDQPGDVVLYNVVIDGYAKIGDIGNAVRLYDQIVVAGMCPTIITCNSLLYGYCKFGDLQDAERYFRAIQISSLRPTMVTYTTFMDALSEAGQVETMLSLLYEMVENRIKPNVVTYSVIIRQ